MLLYKILMDAIQEKKLIIKFNKFFIIIDPFLAVIFFVLSLVYIRQRCTSYLFLFYTFLYLCQTLQHYLIREMPKRDINKHVLGLKRLIGLVCISLVIYLFLAVVFWQKSQMHPLYCGFCLQFGLGLWIGLVIDFHCVFLIFWFVTLLHNFVTRRYYLLGIGGFENELRLQQQRSRHRNPIIQPNYHDFPLPQKARYYKFDDIVDLDKVKNQCSICLAKENNENFVNAGCGHIFHKDCLQHWAKVNTTCPHCRYEFGKEKQQEINN